MSDPVLLEGDSGEIKSGQAEAQDGGDPNLASVSDKRKKKLLRKKENRAKARVNAEKEVGESFNSALKGAAAGRSPLFGLKWKPDPRHNPKEKSEAVGKEMETLYHGAPSAKTDTSSSKHIRFESPAAADAAILALRAHLAPLDASIATTQRALDASKMENERVRFRSKIQELRTLRATKLQQFIVPADDHSGHYVVRVDNEDVPDQFDDRDEDEKSADAAELQVTHSATEMQINVKFSTHLPAQPTVIQPIVIDSSKSLLSQLRRLTPKECRFDVNDKTRIKPNDTAISLGLKATDQIVGSEMDVVSAAVVKAMRNQLSVDPKFAGKISEMDSDELFHLRESQPELFEKNQELFNNTLKAENDKLREQQQRLKKQSSKAEDEKVRKQPQWPRQTVFKEPESVRQDRKRLQTRQQERKQRLNEIRKRRVEETSVDEDPRVKEMRLQREAEQEERMYQYEQIHGISIMGLCLRAQCTRPSKKIRDTEPRVEVTCSGKCLLLYHLACWRHVSKHYTSADIKLGAPCLTPDCADSLTCIVTKETDVSDHYILKPAPKATAEPINVVPHKLKQKELRAKMAKQKEEAVILASTDTMQSKVTDSKDRERTTKLNDVPKQSHVPTTIEPYETSVLEEADEILLSEEQKMHLRREKMAAVERARESEQLKRIKSDSFRLLKKKESIVPPKDVNRAPPKKRSERKSKKKTINIDEFRVLSAAAAEEHSNKTEDYDMVAIGAEMAEIAAAETVRQVHPNNLSAFDPTSAAAQSRAIDAQQVEGVPGPAPPANAKPAAFSSQIIKSSS